MDQPPEHRRRSRRQGHGRGQEVDRGRPRSRRQGEGRRPSSGRGEEWDRVRKGAEVKKAAEVKKGAGAGAGRGRGEGGVRYHGGGRQTSSIQTQTNERSETPVSTTSTSATTPPVTTLTDRTSTPVPTISTSATTPSVTTVTDRTGTPVSTTSTSATTPSVTSVTGRTGMPQVASRKLNTQTIITALGGVAGVVFLIVIILALYLAWRRWGHTRTPTDADPGDKAYHRYSEIDHTTFILDDRPTCPTNQRGTSTDDRDGASPVHTNEDLADVVMKENMYDLLHQKDSVEPSEPYSVLDRRFIIKDDPRLSNYDTTSALTGSVSTAERGGSSQPGEYFILEPMSEIKDKTTSGNITDHQSSLPSGQPGNGQYFLLEKITEEPEGVTTTDHGL